MKSRVKKDYELVQRARENGDQKAFAALLEAYRLPVYYMILRMIRNSSDADDLTIEAFGKAFKSIRDYTSEYAFSTWLFCIAMNNCIDFIRRRRGFTVSMDREDGEEDGYISACVRNMISENKTPDEILVCEQQKVWVHNMVSRLKPHYRTLVEMRYFDELSYEEIAQRLQMPLGSVKAKLFRARNLLSEIIRQS